jgi:hypothetical protein
MYCISLQLIIPTYSQSVCSFFFCAQCVCVVANMYSTSASFVRTCLSGWKLALLYSVQPLKVAFLYVCDIYSAVPDCWVYVCVFACQYCCLPVHFYSWPFNKSPLHCTVQLVFAELLSCTACVCSEHACLCSGHARCILGMPACVIGMPACVLGMPACVLDMPTCVLGMPACYWACLFVYWACLPVYWACPLCTWPACLCWACVPVHWACPLCTGHACLCTGHALCVLDLPVCVPVLGMSACVLGMPSVYLTCLPACMRGCLHCIASLLGETCISTFQSFPTSFCTYFSWTEFTVSSFFTVNLLIDIIGPKIMLFFWNRCAFLKIYAFSHVPFFYSYRS